MRDLADAIADWLTVLTMAGLAFVVIDRIVPPGHLPWRPLRLDQRIGVATRPKVAHAAHDPAVCRAILKQGGVSFQDAPDRHEDDFCDLKGAWSSPAAWPR